MQLSTLMQTLWRQRVVVGAVLLIGLVAFAWAATLGRKYTATATILAVTGSAGDSAVLDPSKSPQQAAIMPADIPNLLHSSTVLKRVGADVHLTPEQTAKLGSEIKAKASLASDVIPVSVTDADPERAVASANAMTRELQRFEQQIATARYDLLIGDLQAQLDQRRAALHAIDARLDVLSTGDPYVTAETGTTGINSRLVTLEQQRDQLRTAMVGDASAATIAAQRPGMARELASKEIVQNDPVFQNLRNQYGKDLAALNLAKAGYTARFPGLSGMQDQVSREASSLAQAESRATASPAKSAAYVSALLDKNKAEATYASDRAQLASLDEQIAAATAHLQGSHGDNLAVAALRRDREAGNQAYAQLSDRLAIALGDRSQAASINSVVVLDEATAAAPSLLSRPSVLAAAIGIVCVWLAITLAFLADGADTRLRSRTTIEELYGTPVLTYVG